MALIQIRQCDRPGCETRIPDGGKRYLLNALVMSPGRGSASAAVMLAGSSS